MYKVTGAGVFLRVKPNPGGRVLVELMVAGMWVFFRETDPPPSVTIIPLPLGCYRVTGEGSFDNTDDLCPNGITIDPLIDTYQDVENFSTQTFCCRPADVASQPWVFPTTRLVGSFSINRCPEDGYDSDYWAAIPLPGIVHSFSSSRHTVNYDITVYDDGTCSLGPLGLLAFSFQNCCQQWYCGSPGAGASWGREFHTDYTPCGQDGQTNWTASLRLSVGADCND
jgi:hypothetical protein